MLDQALKIVIRVTSLFLLLAVYPTAYAQNFSKKLIDKRQQDLIRIFERNCNTSNKPFKCILIFNLLFNEEIPNDTIGRQRLLKKTNVAFRPRLKFPASDAIITDKRNMIAGYGFGDYKLAACEDSVHTKGRGYRELIKYNTEHQPDAFFTRFGIKRDLYLAQKGNQLHVLTFENGVLTEMSIEEFVRSHWDEYFGSGYVDRLGLLAG